MSEVPPVSALVDGWLAWCAWVSDPANRDRFDGPSGHSDFLWAIEEHPERAWEAILKLVEDQSVHCYLGQLAAGPIEDLLSYHGRQFIERVEKTARANATFASTLSGVWQFTMGDDIWARVQAVKGEELTGQVHSGTPNKSLERTGRSAQPLGVMNITVASLSELDESVGCLVTAFAQDPITGFLLQPGPGYQDRLAQFFSLLMRARITLKMPVVVARGTSGIHGAAMGYATAQPAWPKDLAEEWDRFESAIPELTERMAIYDEIAAKGKPPAPHYYLGVIGVHPDMHGCGVGMQLLRSFCDLSRSDPLSCGVYLETAQESNLRFYERAGFAETGRGRIGRATLWCMYLPQGSR